jgi:hypothetical protein
MVPGRQPAQAELEATEEAFLLSRKTTLNKSSCERARNAAACRFCLARPPWSRTPGPLPAPRHRDRCDQRRQNRDRRHDSRDLWRSGALPACPPGSRLLGCCLWFPATVSLPATRHRLGSPVPRWYPGARCKQRAGGQVRAIRVSTPRHTGSQPQVSRAPLQSQYSMAITTQICSSGPQLRRTH